MSATGAGERIVRIRLEIVSQEETAARILTDDGCLAEVFLFATSFVYQARTSSGRQVIIVCTDGWQQARIFLVVDDLSAGVGVGGQHGVDLIGGVVTSCANRGEADLLRRRSNAHVLAEAIDLLPVVADILSNVLDHDVEQEDE